MVYEWTYECANMSRQRIYEAKAMVDNIYIHGQYVYKGKAMIDSMYKCMTACTWSKSRGGWYIYIYRASMHIKPRPG